MKPLTPRQERFADEFCVDFNASAAYKRAGYAARGNAAETSASALLRVPQVQARIQETRNKLADRTQITAARVLEELALIAFADIGQVMDFSGPDPRLRPANEIAEKARRCIASVRVKRYWEAGETKDASREVEVTDFKLADKLSALEKIGKHLAMFVDRVEHTDRVTMEIVEELRAPADEADPKDGGTPRGPNPLPT